MGHVKITIHSLYWDILLYCDNNTAYPFFPIVSFIKSPVGHIDIAKAEININDARVNILNIYHKIETFAECFS